MHTKCAEQYARDNNLPKDWRNVCYGGVITLSPQAVLLLANSKTPDMQGALEIAALMRFYNESNFPAHLKTHIVTANDMQRALKQCEGYHFLFSHKPAWRES